MRKKPDVGDHRADAYLDELWEQEKARIEDADRERREALAKDRRDRLHHTITYGADEKNAASAAESQEASW